MSRADATVYLDYAATSAIRPESVIRATTDYLQNIGATPGRGGHRLAVQADRVALHCRQGLAELLDIPGDPGRIAFFPNATYAINAALFGTLCRNDRVVVTSIDHNAVLRPVRVLADHRDIDVTMIDVDVNGDIDASGFASAITGARVVVLNAASNVLGTTLDLAPLIASAHAAGAIVLVDAAQAAGEIPFSVRECNADLVAFTGHKGLLGPQGTGGLWVREGVDVSPFASGGTGGDSMDASMPVAYPDHLEAGTQNGVGIAGLAAGVEWLLQTGVRELHARLTSHATMLYDGIAAIAGTRVLSPRAGASGRPHAPIVTFVAEGMDASTLAMRLDREHGVLARAGLHCAPQVHRALGTEKTGAVRMSAGWATTESDIESAIRAVAALAAVHA